jgi:YtkA-like
VCLTVLRMPARPTTSLAAALLAAAGCGGTPAQPSLMFSGPPAATVATASGQLTIALWWSPVEPAVGYDASQLAVSDAAGTPLSGATLTVVPWMTAHGHGTSVQPAVTETAPGVYVATPLDFYMSGGWELRTRIHRDAVDGGDAVDDTAAPHVDVP